MVSGRSAVGLWLLLLTCSCSLEATAQRAQAQPTRPAAGKPPSADEQAVRAAAQAYAKAYNAGDAKALAALWTVDGDYTDEAGREFRGRNEIEKLFTATFAAEPNLRLEVQTASVRFLSPEVAIESGTAWAIPAHGNPTSARYSAVQVKRDGNWLLASVHDSGRVAESNSEYLRGLEWLVGQWQAESGDQRLNVKVEWLGNKNFLSRTFSAETGGKVQRSGTQIIGWDPPRRRDRVVALRFGWQFRPRSLEQARRTLVYRNAGRVAQRGRKFFDEYPFTH